MSIEYEKIEKIVLLFWDNEENYNLEKTQQKIGTLFQEIHLINNKESFIQAISRYSNDNQQFLCFVHLAHSKQNKGYDDFINSKILKEFPNLRYYLITSALKNQVYNKNNESLDVYTYDKYQEKIFTTFIPQVKASITGLSIDNNETELHKAIISIPQTDYVIITALEQDEMDKVRSMITKTGEVPNTKHLIEYGYLTSKADKEIAYASQLSTGMIDAAILATELIHLFRPKFLIMTGVLGGKPNDVNIGDVIVATKVFTIDKGKLDETGFHPESETINTDNGYITKFKIDKGKIIGYIKENDPTRNKNIEIHFGSIACVRQVIDRENFFKDNITTIDRKASALEMESYGVTRACELANDGKTIPLIIKSVMDNTTGKVDDAKPYAGWTSAMFVKYILENDLI